MVGFPHTPSRSSARSRLDSAAGPPGRAGALERVSRPCRRCRATSRLARRAHKSEPAGDHKRRADRPRRARLRPDQPRRPIGAAAALAVVDDTGCQRAPAARSRRGEREWSHHCCRRSQRHDPGGAGRKRGLTRHHRQHDQPGLRCRRRRVTGAHGRLLRQRGGTADFADDPGDQPDDDHPARGRFQPGRTRATTAPRRCTGRDSWRRWGSRGTFLRASCSRRRSTCSTSRAPTATA